MKLLVGLGNPEDKYKKNRHNVGHMFIDWLKEEQKEFDQGRIKFVKTSVFMNQSGKEIKRLIKYSDSVLDDLIIVHDDLDIALGRIKIEKSAGPKLHNGLTSIENSIGTKDFWRVRIGVDNRDPENRIDGETYVLQNFTQQEVESLPQIFEEVVDKLKNVFHNELIR